VLVGPDSEFKVKPKEKNCLRHRTRLQKLREMAKKGKGSTPKDEHGMGGIAAGVGVELGERRAVDYR